ncbi:hypothetical protein SAMN05216436_11344 [bacterium A37T11]|nr:hypothetical protein SAMN05216436_11344 [bacterium A37T11]
MKEARIYIADHRGYTRCGLMDVYSTFSWEKYVNSDKGPFGLIRYVNEIKAAKGGMIKMKASANSYEVIIPLYGNIQIFTDQFEKEVAIGEMCCFGVIHPSGWTVGSLAEEGEGINFLHLTIVGDVAANVQAKIWDLPINQTHDKMIAVTKDSYSFAVFMGAFYHKQLSVFDLPRNFSNIFLMTLDGAVEVDDRLLYAGDALGICDIDHVEMECLASSAIILAIALP